jgi:hypothetical protein
MDAYPQDLLVGVFPLVFAVNAILVDHAESSSSSSPPSSDAAAAATSAATTTPARSPPSTRSLFDRFLDAMAASLMDDNEASNNASHNSKNNRNNNTSNAVVSIFRPPFDNVQNDSNHDADYSSDEEEMDELLSGGRFKKQQQQQRGAGSGTSGGGSGGGGALASTIYPGFGRRSFGRTAAAAAAGGTATTAAATSMSMSMQPMPSNMVINTSYAKALTQGQDFFARARIESVSARHGFPPSKDPHGKQNLVYSMSSAISINNKNQTAAQAAAAAADKMQALFASSNSRQCVDGILPAGWLEKHVHALPSVILVVCTVCSNQKQQARQDEHLYATIEHLAYSLVPKRHVTIQVVGLMQSDVTMIQGDGWCRAVTNQLQSPTNLMGNSVATTSSSGSSSDNNNSSSHGILSSNSKDDNNNNIASRRLPPLISVTLLRSESDFESINSPGLPPSPALLRLHDVVRNASLSYYLYQARRTKEKLALLLSLPLDIYNTNMNNSPMKRRQQQQQQIGYGPPDPLLPLVIRYCFKIALFYEFQWKHEKSLRYMAEAHRYTGRYYQYLLLSLMQQQQQQQLETPTSSSSSPRRNNETTVQDDSDDDNVEVALGGGFDNNTSRYSNQTQSFWQSVVPPPPSDMMYQCRAVADWLNLKLLSAGFVSHTEGGLVAATSQWREHARIFCSSSSSSSSSRQQQHSTATTANWSLQPQQEWFEWSYIARQRIVMSELVERHQPSKMLAVMLEHNSNNNSQLLHHHFDEVMLRCSAWRTAESAVEALLRLARELDKVRGGQALVSTTDHTSSSVSASVSNSNNTDDSTTTHSKSSSLRPPFVGGLPNDGLNPLLREECQVNQRDKALKLILRAISLFEQELIRDKRGFYAEDSFNEGSSCRTGARLYYLAGGILLGMGHHREAACHLEKATKYSQGWRELELAVRKLLIECYEKHLPVQQQLAEDSSSSSATAVSAQANSAQANNSESQAMASIILDSYFNSEMSSIELRRALRHFATMSGACGDTLKWYRASFDDEDPSLPFLFEITWPENIFATVGDAVKASVLIKSNLDYAVHVNSVVLVSLAGHLPIPANDLMRATNASEGSEGGIIIQRNGEIVITTEVVLPRDLSIIAADDSGNGGQLQGTAGKGSFAKSAKPRTAGMTSAAGARLLPADQLSPENKVAQGWSMRFLGGKPVKCDGLQIVFYPVQVEKASGSVDNVTLIELLVEKKKPRTAANIKRTPFEEENYIASAWSRPLRLPFSRGPRSLRVLGPQPQMVVTNMTENGTGGKALEGTVNRILLKLQAGPTEHCANVSIRVTCFTVLMSPLGVTKRLVSDHEINEESETSVNMKLPVYRTPVLVTPSPSSNDVVSTEYGYSLPAGWSLADSGQGFSDKKLPSLKGGEATFFNLDFFRPASVEKENSKDGGSFNLEDSDLCKTDFYITVSYRQERPSTQKRPGYVKARSTRRVTRKTPVMNRGSGLGQEGSEQLGETDGGALDDAEETKDESSDEVSLEYSGTIVWEQPISVSFRPGVQTSQPSGIKHVSNAMEGGAKAGSGSDLVVVDGECVTTKCTLRAETNATDLKTEIVGIRFQQGPTLSTAPVDFTLKSSHNRKADPDIIFQATPDDPCRVLYAGSAFSVVYTVQARLKEAENFSSVTAPLGALVVDWSPAPLELPFEADRTGINGHGPLALGRPSTVRFPGPSCHIERAPFEAELLELPASPRVAVPFEVNIRIKNRTDRHQTLSVHVSDQAATSPDGRSDPGGLLVSGLIDGQFALAPAESQILSYSVMATRPGKTLLPMLLVSSPRFRTWIVREASNKSFQIYIFP